jgi:hypothetical protein
LTEVPILAVITVRRGPEGDDLCAIRTVILLASAAWAWVGVSQGVRAVRALAVDLPDDPSRLVVPAPVEGSFAVGGWWMVGERR